MDAKKSSLPLEPTSQFLFTLGSFYINRQIHPFNQQYFRSLNFAALAPPLSIQKAILAATHRFGVTCAAQMSQHRNSTVMDGQHRIPTDSKPLRAIDLRASFVSPVWIPPIITYIYAYGEAPPEKGSSSQCSHI